VIVPFWGDLTTDRLSVVWDSRGGSEAAGEDVMKNPKLERFQQIHGSMTLALLQNKCLTAGSEYIELTKKGCGLLVQIKQARFLKACEMTSFRTADASWRHTRRTQNRDAYYGTFLTDFRSHQNNDDVIGTSANREVNVTEKSEMARMGGAS
jgi:hypothetical protein